MGATFQWRDDVDARHDAVIVAGRLSALGEDGVRLLRNLLVGNDASKHALIESPASIADLIDAVGRPGTQFALECLATIAMVPCGAACLAEHDAVRRLSSMVAQFAPHHHLINPLLRILDKIGSAAFTDDALAELAIAGNGLALTLVSRHAPIANSTLNSLLVNVIIDRLNADQCPDPTPGLAYLNAVLRRHPNAVRLPSQGFRRLLADDNESVRVLTALTVSLSGLADADLDRLSVGVLVRALNAPGASAALATVVGRRPCLASSGAAAIPSLMGLSKSDRSNSYASLSVLVAGLDHVAVAITSSRQFLFDLLGSLQSPEIRRSAAALVHSLSRSRPDVRSSLNGAGALRALIAGMNKVHDGGADDSDAGSYLQLSMAALANLLVHHRLDVDSPETFNGIARMIVAGLQERCPRLRANACCALKNLLYDRHLVVRAPLIVNEIVSRSDLVSLIFDRDQGVQLSAVGILRNLFHPGNHSLSPDQQHIHRLSPGLAHCVVSLNSHIVLEALLAVSNIASGVRVHKIALLRCHQLLYAVQSRMLHPWPEIRLACALIIDNLFRKSWIFKKKRTAELVPVEFLVRIGLKATLEKVRAAEASSECPNVDVVYRVERAIRGFDKTINVLRALRYTYVQTADLIPIHQ
ncbi:Armadillo repeat-containing protein 8 [Plasmodiophora brassicae]